METKGKTAMPRGVYDRSKLKKTTAKTDKKTGPKKGTKIYKVGRARGKSTDAANGLFLEEMDKAAEMPKKMAPSVDINDLLEQAVGEAGYGTSMMGVHFGNGFANVRHDAQSIISLLIGLKQYASHGLEGEAVELVQKTNLSLLRSLETLISGNELKRQPSVEQALQEIAKTASESVEKITLTGVDQFDQPKTETVTVVKRGRGRPPKVKTESTQTVAPAATVTPVEVYQASSATVIPLPVEVSPTTEIHTQNGNGLPAPVPFFSPPITQ